MYLDIALILIAAVVINFINDKKDGGIAWVTVESARKDGCHSRNATARGVIGNLKMRMSFLCTAGGQENSGIA